MESKLRFVAKESIKKGKILCFYGEEDGIITEDGEKRGVVGSFIPLGFAARNIEKGEEFEFDPHNNTKDVILRR